MEEASPRRPLALPLPGFKACLCSCLTEWPGKQLSQPGDPSAGCLRVRVRALLSEGKKGLG